jgi:hypothetical protein
MLFTHLASATFEAEIDCLHKMLTTASTVSSCCLLPSKLQHPNPLILTLLNSLRVEQKGQS